MSELLVTQCPFCQTRFRLTPEQLQVAAGNVRCGACLEVFHAADTAVPASPPASAPQPAAPQRQSALLDDDLDEPDLQALGLDESIIDEVNPGGMTGHRRTGLEAAATEPPAATQTTVEAQADEPATDGFADLHEDFLATPPAQDFGPDFDHNRLGIQSLRPVDEEYADRGIFRRDQPADTPRPAPEPTSDDTGTAAIAADPTVADGPGTDDRQEPIISPMLWPELDEALLETPPARRRQRPWLWGTLCVLALLALPAQFIYYNFDALARDQHSRPLLENLCFLAQCELPARVDISRIRSANLLVRQHPEFPNALAIDVILYNRADFEQPFPVLQMHFTDAGGRNVASRRFRPEEYLSGELAGVRLMPPQTPIHVALDMLDPGPQASGYSLEFASP